MNWITHNKLLFIGLVVVVGGGVWYGLSASSATPASTLTAVSTSSGSPTQESADQQLVATLLSLRAVTLSGTIFQDPSFESLKDFGTPIVAEPVGRTDPFAPLGSAANATAATTTSSGAGAAR